MIPPEKIYEAWSAIASGRVHLESPADAPQGKAQVLSSDGAKSYQLVWDGDVYGSNDNATYWQGYPGYPVIALLMLRGKLPYASDCAAHFAHVNWHEANKKARGDYAKALDEVMARLDLGADESDKISQAATQAYEALQKLDVRTKRYRPKK